MGMITKQPNGKYARISSIVDAPTHTNMSKDELREYLDDTQQFDYKNQPVEEWLERYARDFSEAVANIRPVNMTELEIEAWLKEVAE